MSTHTHTGPQIPPFYCPFPLTRRHDAADLDRRSSAWFADLGACGGEAVDALAREEVALVPGFAMPYGDPEVVRIATDFEYLGHGFDEVAFETGHFGRRTEDAAGLLALMTRVIEVPRAPVLEDNPWAAGLRDLRTRLQRHATETQMARWVAAWRRYFFGLGWETLHRSRGTIPSLDEFVAMRMSGTVGMEILTSMSDIADGYELPTADLERPAVRALTEMSWMLVALDNDLYSYHREALMQGNGLNTVDVIARDENCSPAEAVPAVVAMRDRVMRLFLTLRAEVREHAGEELKQYMFSLGQWVRAHLDWGLYSDRYLRPLGPDSPPSTWTRLPAADAASPADDNPDPLPIPAIAWWWECAGTTPAQVIPAPRHGAGVG